MTPCLLVGLGIVVDTDGPHARTPCMLRLPRPNPCSNCPTTCCMATDAPNAHSPRSSWLVLEGRWRGSERITRFGPPRPEFELLCSRMVVLTTISSRSNPSLIILTITHHGGGIFHHGCTMAAPFLRKLIMGRIATGRRGRCRSTSA